MVNLGHIALDGTKIKANTSKHKAMIYGRMKQEETRLKKEIEELMRQAEAVNKEEADYMKDPTAPEIKPIEPQPVTANPQTTALLVLELSEYLEDPEYFAAPLVPGVTSLLDRARSAGLLIAFTVPHVFKGTPQGQVYSGFKRRACEAVFYPVAFDKFGGGQLQSLLSLFNISTLIITGCKANMAVMITATRAVTEFNYDIVIPVDGLAATTDYEKDYTLYEFRAYPAGYPKRFTFTTLDMINFK